MSTEERRLAPHLKQVLTRLVVQVRAEERHIYGLLPARTEQLLQAGLMTDTVVIRDANTLLPLKVNSWRAVVLFTAC